jgi:hypothetical protein
MEIWNSMIVHEQPVVAIGHHTTFLAEQTLSGCEACDELASVPFGSLVLDFTGYDPADATCILPRVGECPCCRADIFETTLVRRKHLPRIARLS